MLARRRYEEACPGSDESAIQPRQNADLSDERVDGLNNAGLLTSSKQGEQQATTEERLTSAKAYAQAGNFACFGGAEYPDSWRTEAPLCLVYGCNFGKMSQDACLTLGVRKQSKTVIHGIKDTTHANECWLQNSCRDLRPHGEFMLFKM
jgi:hypothetical protein